MSRRPGRAFLLMSTFLLLSLLFNACGGSTQSQNSASKDKTNLDQQIAHARSIGIPESLLKPIINQEQNLQQSSAPFTLFSDQPATDYYTNLSKRYQTLNTQVRGLESQATQQLGFQASQNLKDFQSILSQRQSQGFVEAQTFADIYNKTQDHMSKSQYPKDFVTISKSAKDGAESLRMLGDANDKLAQFQNMIKQLQDANIDANALNQQANSDVEMLRKANKASDFDTILHQLDAQIQGSTTVSTQTIPYVGAIKIKQLGDTIESMKQYSIDTTSYQQHLDADKAALTNAKTLDDFVKFSSQVDSDIDSVRIPLLQGQAKYLVQKFHNEVKTWGSANMYHDSYDNQDYTQNYEYDNVGIGSDLDDALNNAQTPDDFQAVTDLANGDMKLMQAMEADAKDSTSWDQPHGTDKDVMQYFKATSGKVLVVSLYEQAIRVYQDGQFVRAFQTVTGQPAKPSLPGFWHIGRRLSPTIFKAFDPPGSAFWYPDTPITYAAEYHVGGYFFHDSTWRVLYGKGTNYPHADPDNNSASNVGTHGCFNMKLDEAGWVYNFTAAGTAVIVY